MPIISTSGIASETARVRASVPGTRSSPAILCDVRASEHRRLANAGHVVRPSDRGNGAYNQVKWDLLGAIGGIFMLYALAYPVIGALTGHYFPAAPVFGASCIR